LCRTRTITITHHHHPPTEVEVEAEVERERQPVNGLAGGRCDRCQKHNAGMMQLSCGGAGSKRGVDVEGRCADHPALSKTRGEGGRGRCEGPRARRGAGQEQDRSKDIRFSIVQRSNSITRFKLSSPLPGGGRPFRAGKSNSGIAAVCCDKERGGGVRLYEGMRAWRHWRHGGGKPPGSDLITVLFDSAA
jgi:hypothetical protein